MKEKDIDIRCICGNCDDFDSEKQVCTIRYVLKDGNRYLMPRKATQKGCKVFMFKIYPYE